MHNWQGIRSSPESDVEAQHCLVETNGVNGKRSHKVASRQDWSGKTFAEIRSTSVTGGGGWARTGGGVLGGRACPSPST